MGGCGREKRSGGLWGWGSGKRCGLAAVGKSGG